MDRNCNNLHIISEAAIITGLSLFFYKKINELETTINEIKEQINTQNVTKRVGQNGSQGEETQRVEESNRFFPSLLQSDAPRPYRGVPKGLGSTPIYSDSQSKNLRRHETPKEVRCEGDVCYLVDKKVAISKISKQTEFDQESGELDQTSYKVNTFTKYSPNPVIKSITPKPSTSVNVENILIDIDNE